MITLQQKYVSQWLTMTILLSTLYLPPICKAQQLTYSVYIDDARVGRLSADREQRNSSVTYRLSSDVRVKLILSIDLHTEMMQSFLGNMMQQSTSIRKLNGKENLNNRVLWKGGAYELSKKDKHEATFSTPISYSILCMYFQEPGPQKTVFSENDLMMVDIKPAGFHRYVLRFSDGITSYYSYSNGVCTEVETHTGWYVVKFKLEDQVAFNNDNIKK